MSDTVKTYPMHVEIKFHITDGNRMGEATYGHGLHKLPTDEQMAQIIQKIIPSLPEGFRLMDRAESTMYFLREQKGYRGPNMVIPSLGEWFDPATDNDFTVTGDEPEFEEDED